MSLFDDKKPAFKLYLNHYRQWVEVYWWDVHPTTFARWDAGRWAFYDNYEDRLKRRGKFGELHFVISQMRPDTLGHELIHLLGDWLRHFDRTINVYNEEWIATTFDGWARKIWREYRKITKA